MSLRAPSQRILHLPNLLPARSKTLPLLQQSRHRQSFITLPGTTPQTQHLSASRTLPYPRAALYDLIADVDSYSSFVPYCSVSRVTKWSSPDERHGGRRWPTLADLHVGWGGLSEVFTSRLRCDPSTGVVEAVSGGQEGEDASAVFRSLVTRWSLRASGNDGAAATATDVHLDIKYQFTNPLYAAVSAAVSDKVAVMMVEAFEEQARNRLGRSLES